MQDMLLALPLITASCVGVTAAVSHRATGTTQPNWFQTSPESYQGPTATGSAPFLAETNPAFASHGTYIANDPLVTDQPISGAYGRNIFHHAGNLSPYFSSEDGFGVDEYPLPAGANITQMHMLHRHGSRYPSSSEGFPSWAEGIKNSTTAGNRFKGALSFLNDWSYGLGAEVLVPKGRQELFDSGVLNYYNYGHLYNESLGHKLVARTTTQDRMLKSAENFLAGFFGLDWTEKANLLAIIENVGFNNSLVGSYSCTNAMTVMANTSIYEPMNQWVNMYLKNRTTVLKELSGSYNWTATDSHNAQALCVYETISFGYSQFCELFTYNEFEQFSYAYDLMFTAMAGFQNPAGRAQGIAWVEEFLARVEGHVLQTTGTNANMTLATNPVTFPVDQNLYLDFTHDADIFATLAAFGFRQFAQFLPPTGPPKNQQFSTSKVVPFGGRTNIEIIWAPHKVSTERSRNETQSVYMKDTKDTYYVHFLQNQRTLPLHASFPECEYRNDGWCELDAFMKVQRKSLERSQFEYACFGNWSTPAYGDVTDGVPPRP